MSTEQFYSTHLYGPADFDLVGACLCVKYFRTGVISKKMFETRKTYEVIGGYTGRRCPWFKLLRAPNGEVIVQYYLKNPISSKNFLKDAAKKLIEDLSKYFDEDEPVLLVPTASIGITRSINNWQTLLKCWFHEEFQIFTVIGTAIHEHEGYGVPEDKFITIKMLKDFLEHVQNPVDAQFDPFKTEMRKAYIKSIVTFFFWLREAKNAEYEKPYGGNINFFTYPLYDNMDLDKIIKTYPDDEDTAERIIKKYFNDNYGTICASQNHSILYTMKELFEGQMWKDFKEAAKNISTVESDCMPSVNMIANEFILYQSLL